MARDVSARLVPARSDDSKCISSRLINEYVTRMNTAIRKRITQGYREGTLTARARASFSSRESGIRITARFVIKIERAD